MWDFLDQLTAWHYVWFSWLWSHLKTSKNVFWVVARLPQRIKSTFFEIFSHSSGSERSIQKNFKQRWFYTLRQTVYYPVKMRPKLWKSHIVLDVSAVKIRSKNTKDMSVSHVSDRWLFKKYQIKLLYLDPQQYRILIGFFCVNSQQI